MKNIMNRKSHATCTAPIEGTKYHKIKLIALFTSVMIIVILDSLLDLFGV